MNESIDVNRVAEYCRTTLDITNGVPNDEPPYSNIPLCVIDAVFSIGVRYTSTQKVVQLFCDHFDIAAAANTYPLEQSSQLSVSDVLKMYDDHGIGGMTDIYRNRQRTSTVNGILKSEAVQLFCQTLHRFGANYLQDIDLVFENPAFEARIKEIPGQSSGISLRYFYMLIGSDDYVKPDRMLQRFTENAIGRNLDLDDIVELIVKACAVLKADNPSLTPKSLDHIIWNFQRSLGSK